MRKFFYMLFLIITLPIVAIIFDVDQTEDWMNKIKHKANSKKKEKLTWIEKQRRKNG